jgi:hypothetical protein
MGHTLPDKACNRMIAADMFNPGLPPLSATSATPRLCAERFHGEMSCRGAVIRADRSPRFKVII